MNNNFFKKNLVSIIISIIVIAIIATIIYFIKPKDVKQDTKKPLLPSNLEPKTQSKIELENNEDKIIEIYEPKNQEVINEGQIPIEIQIN